MPGTVMSKFGYPKPPGDQPWSVVDVPGPASYTVIVPGTPPTGGQLITAQDCGLSSMDWAQSIGSDNGQYDIVCLAAGFSAGNILSGMRLQWIVSATGAEVTAATNLSARTVRLLVIGH